MNELIIKIRNDIKKLKELMVEQHKDCSNFNIRKLLGL